MPPGCEIQPVLPRTERGPRQALVWGWPTPNALTARTELPPVPRQPVYGPPAREEARRLMWEAKREKIPLGWPTKTSLCKVAKGERPLGFSLWKATSDYLARKRKEREVAQRPPRVGFGSGGPRVLWHHRGGPTEDLRATPYHPGHGLITQRSTRSSAASRTSNAELHSRTLCSAIARLQADAEREVRPRGSPRLQSGSRSR